MWRLILFNKVESKDKPKSIARTEIKLSDMISTTPGKDLALQLAYHKNKNKFLPAILHVSFL